MSKKVKIIYFVLFFVFLTVNRQKIKEHSKKFSNFFWITQIDRNWGTQAMQVIFTIVSVTEVFMFKIFKSLKMTEIDRDKDRY